MAMVKLTGLMNRRDLMSREEFRAHYLDRNFALASGLPGLVKYVGGVAIMSANGDDPPFDACSQLYWRSVDEILAIYQGRAWDASRDDQPNMITGRTMLISEERELLDRVPPGAEPVRYVAVLTRKDAMSREDFCDYWLEQHAPLALQTPHLLRYRACPAIAGVNDAVPAFDGLVEMWFESVQRFEASFRDSFWDRLRKDYYENFAMGRIQFLVQDHLVFDHTAEAAT